MKSLARMLLGATLAAIASPRRRGSLIKRVFLAAALTMPIMFLDRRPRRMKRPAGLDLTATGVE